jgi:hypothetical protein
MVRGGEKQVPRAIKARCGMTTSLLRLALGMANLAEKQCRSSWVFGDV